MQAASPVSFDLPTLIAEAKVVARGDAKVQEYIENILKDATFQRNPQGYIREWYVRRGPTHEYRIPEDIALRFFSRNFPQPQTAEKPPRKEKSLQVAVIAPFDLGTMLQNARSFAKDDPELLELLEVVLKDSDFQQDPQEYLRLWRKERGPSEIYKHPEDDALKFFQEAFNA